MKSTRHQLFSPPVDAFLGSSSSALHEALLQPILEHMEAGVTVYGLDGRIPFFKEAAKRFGMSEPIDLHERTYGSYSFYHPDGSTPVSFAELPSVRVLHQENVYNQEIWVQPPGKAVSILVANGKLLYASSGEPVGALIVTHDITERKWAQQRLEVSEQRYKSLFEHNPDIVCWLDLSGRFLNVNPAFESVTGYTMSDLRNQSFQRLLNREGVRRVLSMSRTIQQGASDNYDISAFHQNGTQIELNVTVVPIVVSQNVVGYFVIAKDITERKQTEETGQIVPNGRWVLEMACQQCVKWQQQGLPPVRLAVNLSMRQLQDKQLVPMVQQILQKTGLHPRYLELEITESIAMHRLDAVIPRLQTLQAMGIQISIDDFGTGYSSLSCLQLLPINSLKIDQSFMRNMTDSSSHMPIVTAIAAMAHSLQLSLVAEGVETAKQLAFLRSLGCLTVQGYFFSKPVPADEREAAGGQLALPVLIAGFVL